MERNAPTHRSAGSTSTRVSRCDGDAETLAGDNKRIARLLRDAKLRLPEACMEDIDASPKREIERSLVKTLATGRWIADHQNVLITGMTGVGKTYVACALAQLACRTGSRALYRRTSRLFDDLALAHADCTYTRPLGKLAKIDVLVLDDWGIAPLIDVQRRDVLEIMDDRHGARCEVHDHRKPAPRRKWHDHLGDPTIADAVLDRLVHKPIASTSRDRRGVRTSRRRTRRAEPTERKGVAAMLITRHV